MILRFADGVQQPSHPRLPPASHPGIAGLRPTGDPDEDDRVAEHLLHFTSPVWKLLHAFQTLSRLRHHVEGLPR